MSIPLKIVECIQKVKLIPTRQTSWSRPATGCIKLNVDASYYADSDAGACGAVLRDSKGGFIAVAMEFKQHALDAPTMEAFAVLLGQRLAEEIGISSISIESDSMEIVQAILNPLEYRVSGAVITDDCRKLMSSFGKATINHYVREANECARVLARFSFLRQESGGVA